MWSADAIRWKRENERFRAGHILVRQGEPARGHPGGPIPGADFDCLLGCIPGKGASRNCPAADGDGCSPADGYAAITAHRVSSHAYALSHLSHLGTAALANGHGRNTRFHAGVNDSHRRPHGAGDYHCGCSRDRCPHGADAHCTTVSNFNRRPHMAACCGPGRQQADGHIGGL